ncbi:cupin domain-containing protein [Rathayibacter sp. YIM 133350]|uniref:cupin domain-containing protein n=1 Tax=Rathayibacter sp. YIM 133350 TaxID=3131992 RepID=UPI00307EEAA7
MSESPVERRVLSTYEIDGAPSFAYVEVRRITIAPNFHAGAHWHNGPVFGVIESGSAYFQVGTDAHSVLHPGDTFYEPGNETIARFDATSEGVTFLAWFPVPADTEPQLTMGALLDRG